MPLSGSRFSAAVLAVLLPTAAHGPPAPAPAQASGLSGKAEAYDPVPQEDNAAYFGALAQTGSSATAKLYRFVLDEKRSGARAIFHVVQDRGQPQGGTYPTYVFKVADGNSPLVLLVKTTAGKKLYLADGTPAPSDCLVSAQKGYSDLCLLNGKGEPAPDLPGLRKDVWSDLIKLFGF